jgi:biopolymer transport protein ExbB/TolQ
MFGGAVPSLVVYGPLGIFVVILLYAVVAQWRTGHKDRGSHTEALEALHKEKDAENRGHTEALEALRKEKDAEITRITEAHKREMETMMTRYISKAESWVEKSTEIANNLHAVLAALERKLLKRE